MLRMKVDGSGITEPVRTMLSSCSGVEPLAFQPWMEIVAEVKPVRPIEELEIDVIVELLEKVPEKS